MWAARVPQWLLIRVVGSNKSRGQVVAESNSEPWILVHCFVKNRLPPDSSKLRVGNRHVTERAPIIALSGKIDDGDNSIGQFAKQIRFNTHIGKLQQRKGNKRQNREAHLIK